jgi:hypothetical protein
MYHRRRPHAPHASPRCWRAAALIDAGRRPGRQVDLKFSRRCTAAGCDKRALWAAPDAAAATRCRLHRDAATYVHVAGPRRLPAPGRAHAHAPRQLFCLRRGGPGAKAAAAAAAVAAAGSGGRVPSRAANPDPAGGV